MMLPLAFAAANEGSSQGEGHLPLWEVGIGGAGYRQPNYPGSDVCSTRGFPFPYLIYRGERLRINFDGRWGRWRWLAVRGAR
jgi:MipA family protein